MINKVWIEQNLAVSEAQRDSAEVMVETYDGLRWRASFVTIPFLQRQMSLTREVSKEQHNMPPVRFIAIETPHVIVENLLQDTVEHTIDNLMTLVTFESGFTADDEPRPLTPLDARLSR